MKMPEQSLLLLSDRANSRSLGKNAQVELEATRLGGLEPPTSGFGDRRSTN